MKYFRCGKESDILVKINRPNEVVEICDYQCKSIELDFGRFSMTYFYSEELSIDPTLLEKHPYQHYNTLFKETKSMFLKSIMKHKNMQYTSTAVKVNKREISDAVFSEPENAEKY